MAVSEAVQRRAVEDRLRESGLVDPPTFDRALQIAAQTRRPVEQVLNQLGSLSDDALSRTYASVVGVPVWEPEARPAAPPDASVSIEFLRRSRLILLQAEGEGVSCAACDPLDQEALDGLTFATGGPVEILVARPGDWRREFERLPELPANSAVAAADEPAFLDPFDERGAESAGGRLVASAFEAAIAAGASDIHFEPGRHGMAVRLRVDGKLIPFRTTGAELAAPTVSRVKVLANLDLGERRLPQDGRTTFVVAGRQVDVRIATSPTVFGEAAVLRILDRSAVPLDLASLGLSAPTIEVLRKAVQLPHGMFLVSGPTGSGKTTTLYALLQTLAGSNLKILSAEDPVEFHFEHVSQTQMAPQLGLTFARALRSFLRLDPDVILVGEIRDPETAATALQAAMTGHLVLASIHANDSVGVIARLLDMDVEPFQLNAALRGASAQRLVRRLCPSCRTTAEPTADESRIAAEAGLPLPEALGRAAGCAACGQTGFKGRLAIGEAYMVGDEALRRLTAGEGAERAAVHDALLGATMLQDGLRKAASLLTTYDEVLTAVSA